MQRKMQLAMQYNAGHNWLHKASHKTCMKLSSITLTAVEDLELHQIDIKSAYLNSELAENEVIYMAQPPG